MVAVKLGFPRCTIVGFVSRYGQIMICLLEFLCGNAACEIFGEFLQISHKNLHCKNRFGC
jgi:hypothetical protein